MGCHRDIWVKVENVSNLKGHVVIFFIVTKVGNPSILQVVISHYSKVLGVIEICKLIFSGKEVKS